MFVDSVEQVKNIVKFCETLEPQVKFDLMNQFYKHILDCIMIELLDGNLEKANKYKALLELYLVNLKDVKPKKTRRVKSSTT